MRIVPALVVLLAACQAPDSPRVAAELGDIRQDLAEVKKITQPRLDAVEAMDDLAREVKQLRQKLASLTPPPPPELPVPAGPLAPTTLPALKAGDALGGVGGTQPGVNDLFWVLARVQVAGEERTVLSLYRALPGDSGFQLAGVRLLNADLKIVEYHSQRPRVKEVLEQLENQKK
jgi:hypothetical protein